MEALQHVDGFSLRITLSMHSPFSLRLTRFMIVLCSSTCMCSRQVVGGSVTKCPADAQLSLPRLRDGDGAVQNPDR